MLNFPTSLRVADLLVTNEAYDKVQIADHNNFYEGGRNFPRDDYLRKKPIESAAAMKGGYHGGGTMSQVRDVRIESAYYANHFAGVINELLSAIVYDPPHFVSPSTDPYWTELNKNADGLGGPISLQVMQSLWSRMMFNRSFYQIVFPAAPAASRADQDKGDGLRARVLQIRGDLVDEWWHDDAGELLAIRKHFKCLERANPSAPAGPKTIERHYWIYHTPEGVFTYTATLDLAKQKEFGKDNVAALTDVKENKSGVFQIVEVRTALNLFVADALFPVAKQIFNASSDSSFARFTSATCTPVMASDKEPEEVLRLGPFNLLNVGANGKLTFATAPADFFNALDAAEEKHKSELYMQVHGMAASTKAAANSGQNTSRESGAAIGAKSKPLYSFLQAFAAGEIAALDQVAAIIQTVQKKSETITTDGLTEYDTADLDDNITRATNLAKIPKVPAPIMDMLLKEIGHDLADICDADKETRDEIENYEAPEPPPEPVPPPNPPLPVPEP